MALSSNINILSNLLKMKLVACEKGSSDNPESRASEVQPQTMEVTLWLERVAGVLSLGRPNPEQRKKFSETPPTEYKEPRQLSAVQVFASLVITILTTCQLLYHNTF